MNTTNRHEKCDEHKKWSNRHSSCCLHIALGEQHKYCVANYAGTAKLKVEAPSARPTLIQQPGSEVFFSRCAGRARRRLCRPPHGRAAPPPPKSATQGTALRTATIMHAWFGPPSMPRVSEQSFTSGCQNSCLDFCVALFEKTQQKTPNKFPSIKNKRFHLSSTPRPPGTAARFGRRKVCHSTSR